MRNLLQIICQINNFLASNYLWKNVSVVWPALRFMENCWACSSRNAKCQLKGNVAFFHNKTKTWNRANSFLRKPRVCEHLDLYVHHNLTCIFSFFSIVSYAMWKIWWVSMNKCFKLCLSLGYFRYTNFFRYVEVMKCKQKPKFVCLTFAFYFPDVTCATWANSRGATVPCSVCRAAREPAVPQAREKLKGCRALCPGLNNNNNEN